MDNNNCFRENGQWTTKSNHWNICAWATHAQTVTCADHTEQNELTTLKIHADKGKANLGKIENQFASMLEQDKNTRGMHTHTKSKENWQLPKLHTCKIVIQTKSKVWNKNPWGRTEYDTYMRYGIKPLYLDREQRLQLSKGPGPVGMKIALKMYKTMKLTWTAAGWKYVQMQSSAPIKINENTHVSNSWIWTAAGEGRPRVGRRTRAGAEEGRHEFGQSLLATDLWSGARLLRAQNLW